MPTLAKNFELKVKEDWLKLPNSTIERLYDPVGGYNGVRNISDFIAYAYPQIWFIECKTIKGNTFPFSNLSQYERLLGKKGIKGVRAGVIVWFYEKDTVLYAPIETIEQMKSDGEVSLNCKNIVDKLYKKEYDITVVPSIKKRTYMDSDYSVLLMNYPVVGY